VIIEPFADQVPAFVLLAQVGVDASGEPPELLGRRGAIHPRGQHVPNDPDQFGVLAGLREASPQVRLPLPLIGGAARGDRLTG